jgi:multiple sugar transport system ATP-binding protein
MEFALKAARLPASEATSKVKAMAEMLEISGILAKYPSSVSGGQQQRASLGRALVRKAELYLLDEPMGQLEPQLRAVLRGRIKHYLRNNGCTSILVTHDQTEANAMADRIAVMESGILQQFASPADLKARPANLFTGTFIGEPPMNVFDARVESAAASVTLDLGQSGALMYKTSELPSGLAKVLRERPAVSVGFRPHAIVIGKGSIRGKVTSCQWLGDQTHIAVSVGDRTVVAVSHDRVAAKTGDDASLAVPANALHVFDPESGLALAHGGAQ